MIIRKLEFEITSSVEDSFNCSHPVIVVKLRGQLFRTQSVGGHNLDGQFPSVQVAEGVERYLSDHGIVRNHHSHCSKQYLRIENHLTNTLCEVRTQSVGGHDLDGQFSSVQVAKEVERNLSDHGIVRNHHSHCSEQYLNMESDLEGYRKLIKSVKL